MHDLARELLTRFLGIEIFPVGCWSGVDFGCERVGTSYTLKDSAPYDLERLVLGEPADSGRPPAFPIATMNDVMIFLREDWSAITVGFAWKNVQLTQDPFEIMEDYRTGAHRVWKDPTRHIEVTDDLQVPTPLVGLWATT